MKPFKQTALHCNMLYIDYSLNIEIINIMPAGHKLSFCSNLNCVCWISLLTRLYKLAAWTQIAFFLPGDRMEFNYIWAYVKPFPLLHIAVRQMLPQKTLP